ncbi:VOC family protein [Mycolicibacterium thermoresistibile]|uniref:Putative biphenyl-2,3-diol 1,2-dioxygenase III n=1 Tax=Mycolicibacterium thermoresistibile (strain ATCC 19527 / DSM 44167 / CIP 105390 / JCM 6362 / NCTC 10409 / 316) TaxID=1078020 RepID=G7CD10_MYCT3|nr:VOC family protein [Mycolicibacterium thermoresistibile]EHI14170.1 putative biphenyl-2,3-diol 1,2-dioxygenase III [Mycolicibacterium thermoresistibile ATCC 19527]MCV7188714.1 VOC family protein [Mycolicibacterium thermoresistibile]SNW18818.1 biphenyl-2,3-diol 1,2-dioxygenase 3 [Mycolicibacterium thermoresistibile]
MASPSKLAHVVFKTSQLARQVDWYVKVLDAQVAFADDTFAFLTYDDEHHRVAFIATGADEPPTDAHTGLHHVAFTYAGLDDLLDTYFRLKSQGVEPIMCINHGPTTSMYYRDPDGNQVELQVDNFTTAEDVQRFIESPQFAANPVGVLFDPEELAARYRAGEPFEELVRL